MLAFVACSGESVRRHGDGGNGENGGGPSGGVTSGGSAGTVGAGKGGTTAGTGGRGGSGANPKGGTTSGSAGASGFGGDLGGAGGFSGDGGLAGEGAFAGEGGSAGEGGMLLCPHTPDLRVPGDFATIQSAIDEAAEGSVIVVGPGTYFEHLDFRGKALELVSEKGPAETVLDGSGIAPVIILASGEPEETVIEGFTLTHGKSAAGAGILLAASSRATIRGNRFIDNQQSPGGYGAAIGGGPASPVIEGNYFARNTCNDEARSGVIAFVGNSSPRIVSNIVVGNTCRGITLGTTSPAGALILGNTLVDNRVGISVNAADVVTTHRIRNNLVVGGIVGLQVTNDDGTRGPTFTNNTVFGSTTLFDGAANPLGTLDNESADPLFVDAAREDFHLRADSPAIDRGRTSEQYGSARDFDVRFRRHGTEDRGAHEFGSPQVCRVP